MKFFKQLLVAPAALGLLSPVVVQAQDLASMNGMRAVNEYMNQQDIDRFRAWESKNAVTSVSQFSDVKPTDWAYQALSNLVETYGCVAGYPNATFRGGNPMSRYEAAALLNACLDRVSEQSDELKRLIDEFQQELAVLRGRVDGLEKKVGKLEAQQFSTTTKLQGEATMVLGGVGYGGSAFNSRTNSVAGTAVPNGISFNYDVRLNFTTSWSGKDMLYTRLRSGNFNNSAFNGAGPYNMTALDKASGYATTNAGITTQAPNTVFIDRIWYRFPIGKELNVVLGPIARNTEVLAVRPTYYNADLLDFFTTFGAPGAYNKATGATFAAIWKQTVKKGNPYFTASSSYVSGNPNSGVSTAGNSNPNVVATNGDGGGLFNNNSRGNWLTQIAYQAQNWGLAAAYAYEQCGNQARRGTILGRTAYPCAGGAGASTNSIALNAWWQPMQSGWIPSISLGWGLTGWNQQQPVAPAVLGRWGVTNIQQTQSWTAGLQWKDAFVKGNAAGFAVGQGNFVTATRNGVALNDGNYAFEWWYRFQVTDNISVTPAIFYLSNPGGNTTSTAVGGGTNNALGALIQTQFKF